MSPTLKSTFVLNHVCSFVHGRHTVSGTFPGCSVKYRHNLPLKVLCNGTTTYNRNVAVKRIGQTVIQASQHLTFTGLDDFTSDGT